MLAIAIRHCGRAHTHTNSHFARSVEKIEIDKMTCTIENRQIRACVMRFASNALAMGRDGRCVDKVFSEIDFKMHLAVIV